MHTICLFCFLGLPILIYFPVKNILCFYTNSAVHKGCAKKNADLFKIQIALLVLIVEKCYAYH